MLTTTGCTAAANDGQRGRTHVRWFTWSLNHPVPVPMMVGASVGVHHSIFSRSAQSSPVKASPGGISASHTGVSAPWARVFTPLCWVMSGRQNHRGLHKHLVLWRRRLALGRQVKWPGQMAGGGSNLTSQDPHLCQRSQGSRQ